MKSPTVVAASCLLSGILAGCDCPKCPEPATTASAGPPPSAVTNAPTTVTTAEVPCAPSGAQGPQGEVQGGTYCVCNEGDHDEHGSFKKPHLAKGDAVVIPDLDMVTRVQLGGSTVPMILTSDSRELHGLGTFAHDRAAGGGGNVEHLVRITPVTIGATPIAGCPAGKNTLKISFCLPDEANGQWVCRPPTGDYGDTHVQN